MTTAMAFAISAPSSSLLHSSSSSSSSSAAGGISSLCLFSSSAIAIPRNAIFHNVKCIPQLGFTPFAQWSGLKSMGVSISQYPMKIERKGKWKGKVYASLFGVGAPEVLVIGVVALLVFGPKGLAEVARNMGKTIRAFQPTIKELQEVSREFKSTLEREIGLDEEPVQKKSSADTAEGPKMNAEPDPPPLEVVDPASKARADWLRGALDQLKKEQEEERLKEESEKTQNEEESQTPSPGPYPSSTTFSHLHLQPFSDTPQAVSDTPQEASPVAAPSENPSQDSLQEPALVAATDAPTPKLEAEVEAEI